jgi:hypothetical protein
MKWIEGHKFNAHVIAFLLMVLPPIPLYLAGRSEASGWFWPLLSLVVLGNLLAVAIR